MESRIRGKIRGIVRYIRKYVGRFGLLGRRRPPKYGIGYRFIFKPFKSGGFPTQEIFTIIEIEYPRTTKHYQYRYKSNYIAWISEEILDTFYTEYKSPNDIMKNIV